MTEDERREILAEMTVEEMKRAIRATMRKSPLVTKEAVIAGAIEAAELALRQSGAADMLPVTLDLVLDPSRPRSKRHALMLMGGKLFGDDDGRSIAYVPHEE